MALLYMITPSLGLEGSLKAGVLVVKRGCPGLGGGSTPVCTPDLFLQHYPQLRSELGLLWCSFLPLDHGRGF